VAEQLTQSIEAGTVDTTRVITARPIPQQQQDGAGHMQNRIIADVMLIQALGAAGLSPDAAGG